MQTLKNSSLPVEDRVYVMDFLLHRRTRAAMTAMTDVIDDKTPFAAKPALIYENDYPLRDHPIVSDFVSQHEEEVEKYKGKTLGQIALERLKKATKKDFGIDKQAWQKWVKNHY